MLKHKKYTLNQFISNNRTLNPLFKDIYHYKKMENTAAIDNCSPHFYSGNKC